MGEEGDSHVITATQEAIGTLTTTTHLTTTMTTNHAIMAGMTKTIIMVAVSHHPRHPPLLPQEAVKGEAIP